MAQSTDPRQQAIGLYKGAPNEKVFVGTNFSSSNWFRLLH